MKLGFRGLGLVYSALFFFLILLFKSTHAYAQLTEEQHKSLIQTARWISSQGISYGKTWRPPDESTGWVMDCSNTARYIYQKAFGKVIPRTASDQYFELKQKGQFIEAPRNANGEVDTPALLKLLRSGDLLFWEWTYNIKREPPVSHVMVYLGQNEGGIPKMVGSSSRGTGEWSGNSSGGVDIYVFRPNGASGGVRGPFGVYIKRGRFIGFGRPFIRNEKIVAEKKSNLSAPSDEKISENSVDSVNSKTNSNKDSKSSTQTDSSGNSSHSTHTNTSTRSNQTKEAQKTETSEPIEKAPEPTQKSSRKLENL